MVGAWLTFVLKPERVVLVLKREHINHRRILFCQCFFLGRGGREGRLCCSFLTNVGTKSSGAGSLADRCAGDLEIDLEQLWFLHFAEGFLKRSVGSLAIVFVTSHAAGLLTVFSFL